MALQDAVDVVLGFAVAGEEDVEGHGLGGLVAGVGPGGLVRCCGDAEGAQGFEGRGGLRRSRRA